MSIKEEIERIFNQAEELFKKSTVNAIETAIPLFKKVIGIERDLETKRFTQKATEYLERVEAIVKDYHKTAEDYRLMGWKEDSAFYYRVALRLSNKLKEAIEETERPVKKEIVLPKPLPRKVIPEPTPPVKEKLKKPAKPQKGKKSKHPGKEKLKELIERHQAEIEKIADDLDVSLPTISRWINQDSELKKLAEDKRKARDRGYKYLGKEKLKKLIEQYQANIKEIADALGVVTSTISRWINQDPELKELAEAKRKLEAKSKKAKAKIKRPKIRKPRESKISEIKTIDELKAFIISGRERVIWIDLSQELHKALVKELAHETKKDLLELTQEDYMKTPLAVLNQQKLGGFYNYYHWKNTTGKPTCRFILEELGLVERILSISEVKTKEEFKELLLKGVKVKNWNQVNPEIQKALIIELAQEAKKTVQDLVREDYEKVSLSSLNNGSLDGLYQYYYREVNITKKRTAFFILEKLGLVERVKEIGEIKEPEDLKKLLVSKAILLIRWGKVNEELQRALVKELVQTVEKEVDRLTAQDFTYTRLDSLDRRTLKDMYLYYNKQNKTGKPTVRYILEELGLVTGKVKALRDVQNTEELKELFDSGAINRVSWSQLPKQVQVMLVKELANTLKSPKRVEELTQNDYTKIPLSILGGNTLGGLHLHYFKMNTTGGTTTRFILEELGLTKSQAKY